MRLCLFISKLECASSDRSLLVKTHLDSSQDNRVKKMMTMA